MNMNGDIDAARKLLSELRDGYECLPRHLQLRIKYLLRESTCTTFTESKFKQPDTSRAGSVVYRT